jgi:hypothetical protein
MAFASAYPVVKAALVTRLKARSGLAGVSVTYEAPENSEDVRGTSGAWESVSFDDAEGNIAQRVFAGASNLIFDEEYVQTCVIQVLRQDRGTQQEADERAGEILYEIHAELANQADWDYDALGLGVTDFEYVDLLPVIHKMVTGFLPAGAGHAARVELGIRVRARRTFNP